MGKAGYIVGIIGGVIVVLFGLMFLLVSFTAPGLSSWFSLFVASEKSKDKEVQAKSSSSFSKAMKIIENLEPDYDDDEKSDKVGEEKQQEQEIVARTINQVF